MACLAVQPYMEPGVAEYSKALPGGRQEGGKAEKGGGGGGGGRKKRGRVR